MTDSIPQGDRVLAPMPPHATVKWKYRSTSDGCEFQTHFDGDYRVEICDQDGDYSFWTIWFKGVKAADGEVSGASGYSKRGDFDIAADTAIAALRAMQAAPHDEDH